MKIHVPGWVFLPQPLGRVWPSALVIAAYLAVPGGSSAQVVQSFDPGLSAQEVAAIEAPRFPLPPEAESADVSRFSYIV